MESLSSPAIMEFVLLVIAFFSALTFHEFSHALAAFLLGDPTARQAGRLTLNPLAHLDPLGLFFLLIFRIGWAKPVPMDPRNFRYPKLYAVLAGLAGPFSNFLLALVSLYALRYFPFGAASLSVAWGWALFFKLLAQLNVMLGLFNLLPIPPLDGSHILYALIPESWHRAYFTLMRFSLFILLVLFLIPQFQMWFMNAITITLIFLDKLVL